jgi:hypothetical protein
VLRRSGLVRSLAEFLGLKTGPLVPFRSCGVLRDQTVGGTKLLTGLGLVPVLDRSLVLKSMYMEYCASLAFVN